MKLPPLCLMPLVLAACMTGPTVQEQQASAAAPPADWAQRLADPVTDPYLFESPVIESSLRPVVARHDFPDSSIFGGGHLDLFALQLRWAVNDRLAVIATKDGWVELEPGTGGDSDGLTDIAGGVKYAFVDDPQAGVLVTGGLVFEGSNGDSDVLQGNGDGAWRPFVSAGWDQGPQNLIATVGAFLPMDGHAESQYLDWHLHWSYEADEHWLPLLEVNGLHYTNNGTALPVNFEAVDYGNLGAADVEGNDVITGAIGSRYRIDRNSDLGLAWEQPLTTRKDIFESRITLDYVLRF